MTQNNRLYRPVPPDFFPSDNIIASLDRTNNIVFYNKDIYDTLPYHQQSKVLYLDEPYLEISAPTKVPELEFNF